MKSVSEARQIVGIFSTYGVEDARKLFWSSWQWGKDFAKRMTFWDAMFLAFDSNDSESGGLSGYIIRLVFQALVNFTIGFIAAFFSFIYSLIGFVQSFSAGLSGIGFFLLASIAAVSFLVTTIVVMCGSVVGAVVGIWYYGKQRSVGGARRQRMPLDMHAV